VRISSNTAVPRRVPTDVRALSTGCRVLLLIFAVLTETAHAGGGPENVLVVVNGDSPISLTIANAYVALRDIPPEHVLWLRDIPYPETISIDTFRRRIWQPISEFITRNRLEKAIDIITYSADFPYAVDFSDDVKARKLPDVEYRGRVASLTGVTYFARRVANGDPYYLAFNGNRYFRRKLSAPSYLPREATKVESQIQREAEKALRDKNFQAAVEHCQTLVRSFPEHGGFRHDLARAYAAAGQPTLAMTALEQAVDHGWTNSLETRTDPYFAVLRDNPSFRQLLLRMEQGNGPFQSAHGFSSQYEWTGANQPVKSFTSDSLDSYYLSTLLAYTGSYGNSVPEVKNYLDSAAASDGTRPDGTVYLLVNHDVRSETREPLFLETVAELKKRGHRAEILSQGESGQDGNLPRNKGDVIGAVVGSASFSWKSSGSRLLPGAIAESLTSYGGVLERGGQTKLTEFLRYGAAGSSGAVAEPFSIQAKFPVPLLHVYFADGCSLAEAFYQSVEAPYQLIVVGDPLARPFARFARVRLSSPDPRHIWSGVVTLQPEITPAPDRPVEEVEFWVDGQLTAYALPDAPILWDTRTVEDGYHDVRLVAVESDAVETRSYRRLAVTVSNTGHRLEADPVASTVHYGDTLTLSGSAPGGTSVAVWQGKRLLASAPVTRGRWQMRVTTSPLGIGPVTLVARARFADRSAIRSAPFHLEIEPPRFATAPISAEAQDKTRDDAPEDKGPSEPATKPLRLDGRLDKLPGTERLTLSGEFIIHQAGFYEFIVNASGELSLDIDGAARGSFRQTGQNQPAFVPLGLAAGRHHLEVEYTPRTTPPFLKMILEGDQQPLNPEVRLTKASPAG
jgi:hypothetical protein